jgi:glycosyltransferase involved in cell wall biosynthesis
MKITIVTVTLNSEDTIRDTLNSILSQTYKNIEHIIVDGGSKDKTLDIINKYPNKNKKIYKLPGSGIYRAINYGIKKSSGTFITILNSDDFFHSEKTIADVVKIIKRKKNCKIFFSDVAYFRNVSYYDIRRLFSAKYFKKWQMRFGLMPAHPGSFIKNDIYKKYGLYEENFKIASDFEFFLRVLFIESVKYLNIPCTTVRMRLGGISSKNIWSYIISTNEIIKSHKLNNLNPQYILISLRFIFKIRQLYMYNVININKTFKLFKILFDKSQIKSNSFTLINDFKKIPFKNNFILSAMNLAFLGYFSKKEVSFHKDQYHWLDGIWAKRYINIKKRPGRELISNLKIPNDINQILIIGNATEKTIDFLSKKFKKKILQTKLPYASIKVLKKKVTRLKPKTLTLITLPTPKQEQLAYHLAEENNYYKIICIGASLAIASGEEKKVPHFLTNYEFIWRLRTDTFRRLKRLIESLYYYVKGTIIKKIYIKIPFREID